MNKGVHCFSPVITAVVGKGIKGIFPGMTGNPAVPSARVSSILHGNDKFRLSVLMLSVWPFFTLSFPASADEPDI